MHEAVGVNLLEPPREFESHECPRTRRKTPGRSEGGSEVHAFDVFLGDERLPPPFEAVVYGDHIRMVDRTRRAGFAPETLLAGLVAHEFSPQRLQHHVPVECRLVCPVHDSHAALSEFTLDRVVLDRLVGGVGHAVFRWAQSSSTT